MNISEFVSNPPADCSSTSVSSESGYLDEVLGPSKPRIIADTWLTNHKVRKVSIIEESVIEDSTVQESIIEEKEATSMSCADFGIATNYETSEKLEQLPNENTAFQNAFLCPTDYLSKRKQEKIKKGKPKFIAAALSDDWQKMVDEKEAKKGEEEDKKERKKALQEQKKELMKKQKEELHKLQEEINSCAKKRIKKEKISSD